MTKELYSSISHEFDSSRQNKIWPCVGRFLSSFSQESKILDIGCGNGKNMAFPDLAFTGIDFCPEFVEICQVKGHNVVEGNMTSIPFPSEGYDGFIAVASYHHLDNDGDRKKALGEMYRILKKGGRGLIVVWAREQEPDSRFVFNSGIKTSQFGWDEFVVWKGPYYKDDNENKENNENKEKKEKKRYYHVYEKDDLVNEVSTLCPSFCIESIGWEKGNWIVCVKK